MDQEDFLQVHVHRGGSSNEAIGGIGCCPPKDVRAQ